jgi:hypothetical protein
MKFIKTAYNWCASKAQAAFDAVGQVATAAVLGTAVAVTSIAPAPAQAAVPAAVTTAITDATADIATVGGAVLVVVITIATFIWLRRPMH